MSQYDHLDIAEKRRADWTWPEIADEYDRAPSTVRKAHKEWQDATADGLVWETEKDAGSRETDSVILTKEDISRITSLEDLLDFFEVDTERWQVNSFRVNKWEQHSVKKGVVPLYQVRANLGRNLEREAEIARQVLEQAREDMLSAEPPEYEGEVLCPSPPFDGDEPHLLELAVFDPHLGMYAWGREVGEPYDSDLGVQDYGAAVDHLLGMHQFYNVDRVLYVVGNDLLHVDGPGVDGRGGLGRGGATTAGTVQDFDSRLAKVFTMARRAVVNGIDKARAIAPVDVLIVPGNHDEQTMYKLGEVLAAWYRTDERVRVLYDPTHPDPLYHPQRRKFYGYGANTFMFTHGVEYKRSRDNLPLIFATECPPDLWVQAEHLEVHTGHNHVRRQGRYVPDADVTEERAIITRSLPGLTPEDSWHYNQGYKHRRGATALVYRESGGIAGLHEFNI